MGVQGFASVISVLLRPDGRQKQQNLWEMEASGVYKSSSRTARNIQRNPGLENKTQNKTKQKKRKDMCYLYLDFGLVLCWWC